MELPEIGDVRRENITYGIESNQPQAVYETFGTGQARLDQLLKAPTPSPNSIPITPLDQLMNKIRQSRTVREELCLPQAFQSAPERLEALKAELEELQTEFDQVCRGKENLIQLAIRSESLTAEQVAELEKETDGELSRILDERDMAGMLKACRSQIEQLESDQRFQQLPQMEKPLLSTSVETLRKKLQTLRTGDAQASFELPAAPTVPDVDVASLSMRLSELERIVGLNSASRLKYSFTDLPSALCQLTHQLILLDPKRVEAINERTSALAKEHERLAGVLTGYGDYEKKIETLYTNLSRWVALSRSLPQVILLQDRRSFTVTAPSPTQIISKLESCANLSLEVSTLDSRVSSKRTCEVVAKKTFRRHRVAASLAGGSAHYFECSIGRHEESVRSIRLLAWSTRLVGLTESEHLEHEE